VGNTAPTFLIRDNDRAYGKVFLQRITAIGIRDRRTAARSPWQNAYNIRKGQDEVLVGTTALSMSSSKISCSMCASVAVSSTASVGRPTP
jgi:hypothetical protein